MSANMTRRNGPVIKSIIVVAVMICGVYFIYLYNNVSGKLKETERVAERYRREQESLRTQLQDLSAAKDEQQQRSENEKKEFVNRLNTLNQHHKMLKSQHDDLEADYARLQSEKDKQKDDVRLQEEQRNQEYMQLKQEKDLEISSLKDQIANLGREKAELEQQVFHLSSQLKESQKIQEQMRTEQSDITQQAQTLKNQLVLERSSRATLENQIQQLKKENLHYQGSVNFLQQELFNMQEQVKRQQIQLLQTQQSQKLGQSQNALGQQSQKFGQSQNAAVGQQPQGGLQQELNQNINNQGNQLNGNENFGNIMNSLQGERHPVVGGNAVNQGQGSMGNRLGINQEAAAIKVNRFNQGLKVKTGDGNLINQRNQDKQDSNVIDQQQQQHQVQPPNLNHQMELQRKRDDSKQVGGAAVGWHDNKEVELVQHKRQRLGDSLRREKEKEFEQERRLHEGVDDDKEEDEKAKEYEDDYDNDDDTDNNKNNPGFAAANGMPRA